jgi:nucleoside-diphosphate-sugar epimerase
MAAAKAARQGVKRKRLLICGTTGFIGRNLAEFFTRQDEFQVVGVCHKMPAFECSGLEWIQADLTDPRDVDRVLTGVDVVIQAAATTSGVKDTVTRPHIHVADNAVMNSLLFRAAFDKHVGHVVFFSCTVMLQSSERGQTEEDFDANVPIHPRYFGAGWTKVYLEKMSEFYSRIGPTRYTVIRHSNIYGPHDKFDLERSHVFGATVTKVMTARDGRVVVWGSGEEGRDLLYIDDLSSFVDRAIRFQAGPFAIYNCGYGEAIRVKDLVSKIVEISRRPLRIEFDLSQPSIKTSLYLDCGKAKRELGWERKTSLEAGIEKTIAWWRQNIGMVQV